MTAVSHAMFGRLARWRKDRIGGTVWYLDCELAEGYADSEPVREPKGTTSARRHGQGHVGVRHTDCQSFASIGSPSGYPPLRSVPRNTAKLPLSPHLLDGNWLKGTDLCWGKQTQMTRSDLRS